MIYLITGITGFLGRALTRALLEDPATKRVVGFSSTEGKVSAFRKSFQDPRVDAWIGNVRERDRMRDALGVNPDVVIHAAAMKRIEECDRNPDEAFKTNELGTRNVVRACRRARVPKVLVISSDKATSPETYYGTTKSGAEQFALGQNAYSGKGKTRISVIRYGNIIGSTGSFINVLLDARRTGATVELTDPNCTRFWWKVDEAVAFIRRVIADMQGSEIWVPKLTSASLGYLASEIAPNSPQVVVGMRGPEKIHEAMINETEARNTYELSDCYVLLPKAGQPWSPAPPIGAVKVPEGFSYSSSQQPSSVRLEVHEAQLCTSPS